MNYIKLNFNYLVESKKLNQSELAKDLNVSVGKINAYKQQRATPTHEFIQMFCKEFNINIDDFYNKDLSKHPELLNSDYVATPKDRVLKIKNENKIFTKIKIKNDVLTVRDISRLIVDNKHFFEEDNLYHNITCLYKQDAIIEYLEKKKELGRD
jgi:transcriptional regulator with XRE-family HTH domain